MSRRWARVVEKHRVNFIWRACAPCCESEKKKGKLLEQTNKKKVVKAIRRVVPVVSLCWQAIFEI